MGGYTAFALSREHEVEVIDFDLVEEKNLGVQIYLPEQEGMRKVEALWEICKEGVTSVHGIFPDEVVPSIAPEVVVSALDNWRGRRELLDFAVREPSTQLFIDCRIAQRVAIVLPVLVKNRKEVVAYKKTLGSDNAPNTGNLCGMQSTVGTATFAASVVSSIIDAYGREEPLPNIVSYDTGIQQPVSL